MTIKFFEGIVGENFFHALRGILQQSPPDQNFITAKFATADCLQVPNVVFAIRNKNLFILRTEAIAQQNC